MFYTAVFLAGEWSQTDFTWPGKILCMFLCVMGIALFAIPVGTVFEAFQDVLQEVSNEDEGEGVELTREAVTSGNSEDAASGFGSFTVDIGELPYLA